MTVRWVSAEVWLNKGTEESGGERSGASYLSAASVTAQWDCHVVKGRRMSSQQHTSTEGTDDYTVQQENELEALASIFGDDFQDLRNKDPWKVR